MDPPGPLFPVPLNNYFYFLFFGKNKMIFQGKKYIKIRRRMGRANQ